MGEKTASQPTRQKKGNHHDPPKSHLNTLSATSRPVPSVLFSETPSRVHRSRHGGYHYCVHVGLAAPFQTDSSAV